MKERETIMKYREAIGEFWQNEDELWVFLKPGYGWGVNDDSIVKGKSYRQVRDAMKDVHRIKGEERK